jgi:formylglycine-generating enzyme required for sulfatase activity
VRNVGWRNQYCAKKTNNWQGQFPFINTEEDGFIGTASVGSFPANGYGLYDMTGNVWEWTKDWYRVGHQGKSGQKDPLVDNKEESLDPREPDVAKLIIKGGSYLCAKNYCSRYRPAAKEAEAPNTGTSHISFRLFKNNSI